MVKNKHIKGMLVSMLPVFATNWEVKSLSPDIFT